MRGTLKTALIGAMLAGCASGPPPEEAPRRERERPKSHAQVRAERELVQHGGTMTRQRQRKLERDLRKAETRALRNGRVR